MTFNLDLLIPGISGGTWYLQKQEPNDTYEANPTVCTGGNLSNKFTTTYTTNNGTTGGAAANTQVWQNKTVSIINGNELDLGTNTIPGVFRLLYLIGGCGGTCQSYSLHTVNSIGEPVVTILVPSTSNLCATLTSPTTVQLTGYSLNLGKITNLGVKSFPGAGSLNPPLTITTPRYSIQYYIIATTPNVTPTAAFVAGTSGAGSPALIGLNASTAVNPTLSTTSDFLGDSVGDISYDVKGETSGATVKQIFNGGSINFTIPSGLSTFSFAVKAVIKYPIGTTPLCEKTYTLNTVNVTLSGNAGSNTSTTICV